MAQPFRFAVCNELFQSVPFGEICRKVRELGYEGLEIAPFTLAEQPLDISAAKRKEIHKTLQEEGLCFVGLHWLLVSSLGLHVTTPDMTLRRRSWEHIRQLIDLCADLAGCNPDDNGVLVFGSPKQRSTVDGMSRKDAMDVFTNELAHVAAHAEDSRVKILVEALPKNQSDVINTLAEAVAIVRQIGSPAIKTMFDTHNAVDETEPHAALIRKYFPYIFHIHVNEADGREPGMGDYDFTTVLSVLKDLDYPGWISLEAFDFSRDPEEIAGRAIRHLQVASAAAA
ncbi:MAG TPA: sugar phosphate isomerase/epimerase family protein [Bryobacteraceae bacterium]|jgi:sugar phosphate isomerase/epimerase|nr:sugar phosphate isomerase/epimerase family protein [Bryobacteraceae bacterium]